MSLCPYYLTERQYIALQNLDYFYKPPKDASPERHQAFNIVCAALWNGIGEEQGFIGTTAVPDPRYPGNSRHILAEPIPAAAEER